MDENQVRYQEKFPVGSIVQIISRPRLEEFMAAWSYHHPLQEEQLNFGGCRAVVESVGFYHGGDVLYELTDVPGIWHEVCLTCPELVGLQPVDNGTVG